jgi:hypothetical protein
MDEMDVDGGGAPDGRRKVPQRVGQRRVGPSTSAQEFEGEGKEGVEVRRFGPRGRFARPRWLGRGCHRPEERGHKRAVRLNDQRVKGALVRLAESSGAAWTAPQQKSVVEAAQNRKVGERRRRWGCAGRLQAPEEELLAGPGGHVRFSSRKARRQAKSRV